jgi:hypothetical protein
MIRDTLRGALYLAAVVGLGLTPVALYTGLAYVSRGLALGVFVGLAALAMSIIAGQMTR